jgi:hypothetical protein
MRKDPIVEEVRRARNQHAAKLRYDLDAICRDLKEEERQGRRKLVSLPPRRAIRSAKSA